MTDGPLDRYPHFIADNIMNFKASNEDNLKTETISIYSDVASTASLDLFSDSLVKQTAA